MSVKQVMFLGRSIEISDQLPTYVDILNEFEKYGNELYAIVVKQAKKGEYTGNVDEDFVAWRTPIENVARKVITSAANFGVYDLTIADLVDENPGVTKLRSVCEATMKGLIQNLLSAINDTIDGLDRAERQAASHITGSGVSIWTSSLSSALIYNAMEMSTIKKQCNQADKEYNAALVELSKRTTNSQKQGETRILTQTYYPGCNESIAILVSYMLEVYLKRIGNAGKFDYSEVKGYDMAGSIQILQNMKLVQEKEEVLVKAFEKCPYNPDLYKVLLDADMVDADTFSNAVYLKQNDLLLSYVISYCKNIVAKGGDVSDGVKVWAMFTGKDEVAIYQEIYKDKISSYAAKYKSVVSAINSESNCREWIRRNITDAATELLEKKSSIASKVSDKIKGIASADTFSTLVEVCKMQTDDFNLTGNVSANYEMITADLTSKLINAVNGVVNNIEMKREELAAEMKKLDGEIALAKQEYDSEEKKLQSNIDEIKREKEALGFFAFSKKKEAESRLYEATRKKEDCLKTIKDKQQSLERKWERLNADYERV